MTLRCPATRRRQVPARDARRGHRPDRRTAPPTSTSRWHRSRPQAAAHGAEVLVVDDGPERRDPRGRRAPRRALPRPRPPARAQRRAQHGDRRDRAPSCWCSSTTTSRAAPGWLEALLSRRRRAARRRRRARPARSTRASRTTASAPAGARAPPITSLDLGAADRDCAARLGREHGRAPQRDRARRARSTSARELYGDEAGVAGALAGDRRAHPLRRRRRARPPPRRRRRAPALAVPAPHAPAGGPAAASTSARDARRRSPRSCARSPAAPLHGPRRALRDGPGHDVAHARPPARPRCARAVAAAGDRPASTTSSRARSGNVEGARALRGARARRRCSTCARCSRAAAPRLRRAAARGARRRVLVLAVERRDVPSLLDRGPRRARALAPRASTIDGRAEPGGRGKFENLNAPARRPRPEPVRLAAGRSTTTSSCRAASSTRFLAGRRAGRACASPSPRTASTRTPPGP